MDEWLSAGGSPDRRRCRRQRRRREKGDNEEAAGLYDDLQHIGAIAPWGRSEQFGELPVALQLPDVMQTQSPAWNGGPTRVMQGGLLSVDAGAGHQHKQIPRYLGGRPQQGCGWIGGVLLLLIGGITGSMIGWRGALRQQTHTAQAFAEREATIKEALMGHCERTEAYKAGWQAALESPRHQEQRALPPFAFARAFLP